MKREVCKQTAEKLFIHMKQTGQLQSVIDMAKEKVATRLASEVAGSFHKLCCKPQE